MSDTIRLERIFTLPAESLLQYKRGSDESFYFYDSNHNLKLDPTDSKVIEKRVGKNQSEFEGAKVSKADLRSFGAEAKGAFAQARQERDELRKSLPSASAGRCFALSSRGSVVAPGDDELLFRPELNLRTARVQPDKFYSLLELMNHSREKPVNPARCFMARAVVAREKVADSPLSSHKVILATGDLLSPLVFQALGLTNGELLDAAYSVVGGAERVHFDLDPPQQPKNPKKR